MKSFITLIFVCFLVACATAKNNWEYAKSKDTDSAYKSYVHRYPDSIYATEARIILEQRHNVVWQGVVERNSISGYQSFLRQHKGSPYADEARRRFEQLQEQADYDNALHSDSVSKLRAALTKYPDGVRHQEISLRLFELEKRQEDASYRRALESKSLNALTRYTDKYSH